MTDKPTKPTIGKKVSNTAKSVTGKAGEKAKGAASAVSSGAKSAGKTVKNHPIKTAAAVGGVAAAAAGAVVGKKMYDKRKANTAKTPSAKTSAD